MLTKSSTLALLFLSVISASPFVIAETEATGSVQPLEKNTQFEYTILEVTPAPAESTVGISTGEQNTDSSSKAVTSQDAVQNDSHIVRSQFTTAVVNLEPTDDVVMLTNNSNKIYYFSELSDLKGHNVTHRWQYKGKTMAEVTFNVKSDRWRVFSSKTIRPDWTGDWSVVLTDEDGQSLSTDKFQVVETSGQ